MKSFVTALILALVIVVLGVMHTSKIEKLSDELLKANEKVSEAVDRDDFKEADLQIKKIRRIVEENRMILTLSMDHNEVDKIEMNVAQLEAYVEEEKREDALSFSNVLETLFIRLPKNYRLKIENVL